ncbi:MAG TPA: MarP family serine protease [Kineosporiaceae bacterium]|nr:MarP family serine protease [Kineosporiaceae bacterium]
MIDIVLLLIMLGYAISGFRQGLVVGVLSLGGFVGGAMLAMLISPLLLGGMEQGPRRSVVVLLAVIVSAWVGQFAGAMLGGRLREAVPRGPIASADHAAGAVAGLVAVSLVLWFVAGAVRGAPSPALAKAVGSSKVIQAIDGVVPSGFVGLADTFRDAVGGSTFPRVFAGIGPENITPVSAPDPQVLNTAAVVKAQRSVVKITGEATSCGRGQEGSGVVISPRRVVTNAHVVAGVRDPYVQVGGTGNRYRARVVSFDPRRDLAVLAVKGLPTTPLDLGSDLRRGDLAVVAGFPNDGPFVASAARVRSIVRASGEDIYGRPGAVREVYSLYVNVQPGNSGGPVLNASGAVVGIVFAKSLDDTTTGYALTLDESRAVIEAGATLYNTVSTGGCASG